MWKLVTLAAFFILLWRIGRSDYRTRMIPDRLTAMLAFVGVLSVWTMPQLPLHSRGIGLFAASLPLLLCAMAFPASFGGGDIKLMAGAGFFLGYRRVLVALLLGLCGGGIYGAGGLLTKRAGRKTRFALGPFLCAGIVLAYFWGDTIWEWLAGG